MSGKRKFSYYNDYSTVNFGGSGGQRRSRSSEGRPRRADREHKWCEDCGGSGVCNHCKDGRFPLVKGGTTTCRMCSGNTKCHACRGSRLNGKACDRTPTYEQALERQKEARRRQASGVVEAIIGGAMTVGGVLGAPTQNEPDTMSNWGDTTANQEAGRRSRDTRGGTRDKGVRDRGTRRDPRR